VATGPSFITPSPTSVRSSAWTITGAPVSREYSSTRRITPASMMVWPSSLKATAPAAESATFSVITSPRRPWVGAASG
jgi:hypothetical protein